MTMTVPVPTDGALAAAFAAGNREAGDELFARYAAELGRFLGARCRDADLAGDLLQEVAARLVLAASRLDPDRNTRAYLFRTARNVWTDYLRREITRRRATARLISEPEEPAAAPDARLLHDELLAAVRRTMDALPGNQRDVLGLRHREGITFREIAERLGRPLGTVLAQMHAAVRSIAKICHRGSRHRRRGGGDGASKRLHPRHLGLAWRRRRGGGGGSKPAGG